MLKNFIDMRKAIKKPMTSYGLELLINKVRKLSSSEEGQIELLNQAIEKSWQTVYPLKQENETFKSNSTAEEEFLNEQS